MPQKGPRRPGPRLLFVKQARQADSSAPAPGPLVPLPEAWRWSNAESWRTWACTLNPRSRRRRGHLFGEAREEGGGRRDEAGVRVARGGGGGDRGSVGVSCVILQLDTRHVGYWDHRRAAAGERRETHIFRDTDEYSLQLSAYILVHLQVLMRDVGVGKKAYHVKKPRLSTSSPFRMPSWLMSMPYPPAVAPSRAQPLRTVLPYSHSHADTTHSRHPSASRPPASTAPDDEDEHDGPTSRRRKEQAGAC